MVAQAEVERKWLVAEPPPDALAAPAEQIEQGYLTIGDGGCETRLRRRGERFTLTVKSGAGLVRSETEIELTRDQFEALWPATAAARLSKRRHVLRGAEGGETIELDEYAGSLAGLVVAEVEFRDLEAAAAYVPPPWFGREVTAQDAYRNQRLALVAGGGVPAPKSR